jgi:hypothetical protein
MATTAPHPAGAGQLLLAGQAAAPDGPVDLTLMWLMHHGFRRDLEQFARAVPATPLGDRATWQALGRRWGVFARILHAHHRGEDSGLWPLLLERVDTAGEADARATLEAMSAEHARIDPSLQACAIRFDRLSAGADEDARRALNADLAATREHLDRHLCHEERDAMAVLQRHLTQQDWDRVGKEHFEPHYAKRDLPLLAAWLLEGVPPVGIERLEMQPSGRLLVLLWRLMLRRPFTRRGRRVFRYAY